MRNLNSLKVSGVRKKHLNKVYITKHSTDGASCVSEVLVCKYAKALLMMHHSAEKVD